jgi:hypothetical protein
MMKLDFTLCKEIDELVCLYCIFWKSGKCVTSKPPWEFTESTDSCGDGYWRCEVWKYNTKNNSVISRCLTEDFMTLAGFIRSKLEEGLYEEGYNSIQSQDIEMVKISSVEEFIENRLNVIDYRLLYLENSLGRSKET